MTVRGCETIDPRTVELGQFGGFPEVDNIEAERQLVGVLVGAAALQVGNLFDVRLGELRVVDEATLPVAFEG